MSLPDMSQGGEMRKGQSISVGDECRAVVTRSEERSASFKPNATDRKVMANVEKHGFTFATDSLFRTVRQGVASLNRLTKAGWLVPVKDQFGTAYRMTGAGHEAVAFPVSHGLVQP